MCLLFSIFFKSIANAAKSFNIKQNSINPNILIKMFFELGLKVHEPILDKKWIRNKTAFTYNQEP